jgi:hypothetical protein
VKQDQCNQGHAGDDVHYDSDAREDVDTQHSNETPLLGGTMSRIQHSNALKSAQLGTRYQSEDLF